MFEIPSEPDEARISLSVVSLMSRLVKVLVRNVLTVRNSEILHLV